MRFEPVSEKLTEKEFKKFREGVKFFGKSSGNSTFVQGVNFCELSDEKKFVVKKIDVLEPHILKTGEKKEGDSIEHYFSLIELYKTFSEKDLKNVVRLEMYYHEKRGYYNIFYLFFRHFSNGDLYRYSLKRNGLFEHEAQFFFRSILKGIKELHSNGVSHLDIKPSNCIISDNFKNIIIIDFESFTSEKKLTYHFLKTPQFSPPEVMDENFVERHCPKSCDVYALGILLLTILSNCLINRKGFFEREFQNKKDMLEIFPFKFYSSELCNLLFGIISEKEERMKLDEIFEHPWVKNEIEVLNLVEKENFYKVKRENMYKYSIEKRYLMRKDKDFRRMIFQRIENSYRREDIILTLFRYCEEYFKNKFDEKFKSVTNEKEMLENEFKKYFNMRTEYQEMLKRCQKEKLFKLKSDIRTTERIYEILKNSVKTGKRDIEVVEKKLYQIEEKLEEIKKIRKIQQMVIDFKGGKEEGIVEDKSLNFNVGITKRKVYLFLISSLCFLLLTMFILLSY